MSPAPVSITAQQVVALKDQFNDLARDFWVLHGEFDETQLMRDYEVGILTKGVSWYSFQYRCTILYDLVQKMEEEFGSAPGPNEVAEYAALNSLFNQMRSELSALRLRLEGPTFHCYRVENTRFRLIGNQDEESPEAFTALAKKTSNKARGIFADPIEITSSDPISVTGVEGPHSSHTAQSLRGGGQSIHASRVTSPTRISRQGVAKTIAHASVEVPSSMLHSLGSNRREDSTTPQEVWNDYVRRHISVLRTLVPSLAAGTVGRFSVATTSAAAAAATKTGDYEEESGVEILKQRIRALKDENALLMACNVRSNKRADARARDRSGAFIKDGDSDE